MNTDNLFRLNSQHTLTAITRLKC